MDKIDIVLVKLSQSSFRNSFKLHEKEISYLREKSLQVIEEHAYQFVRERLSMKNPFHDGKQTPMKGHPVFIAQHATACCCRGCLEKWHHIKKDHDLTEEEITYVVEVIMRWMKRELE